MSDPSIQRALQSALEEASRYRGATAPNPPVGAAAINSSGKLLGVAAHTQAGTAHAEAKLIELLRKKNLLSEVDSLVITLEPCNHTGKTPPCTEAILGSGIKKIYYGVSDPNPKVEGGGAQVLQAAGVQITDLQDEQAKELLAPFAQWSTTGLPWITVKTAHLAPQSGDELTAMIPPVGQTTFTSDQSLRVAHALRKRADAIVTGSGTVLADAPRLTVRLVPDHPGKQRFLGVIDRRKQILSPYYKRQEALGFSIAYADSFQAMFEELGKKGCLEVLVEAGPTLTQAILTSGIWNEHVVITKEAGAKGPQDRVETKRNVHWNYKKSGSGQPVHTE